MKLLSRYLLREHLPPFVFALAALTGLMLLNQVARQFSQLVGKGLPWSVIGEVFGLSVPFILAMTLPMAVLVAVLYAFVRLGADNEITALKASGINLVVLVRPVLVAGIGVALVNFAFNDLVLPRTNHKLRTLTVDIMRKKPTFELKEQMVNAVIPGQFYLRASRIDPTTDRLREVVIYDLANADRRRTIHADSGYMRFATATGRTDLHLTLFDGFIHDYDRAQPGLFRRVFFRTDWVRMRGVTNAFQRTDEDTYKGDREMSVCEMDSAAADQEEALAMMDLQATLARQNDIRRLLGVGPAPPPAGDSARHRGAGLGPYCGFLARVTRWLAPAEARADTVHRFRNAARALHRVTAAPLPAGRGARAPAPAPAPRPVVPLRAWPPAVSAGAPAAPPPPRAGLVPGARPPSADVPGVTLRSQREVLRTQRLGAVAALSRYRVEIHKKFSIPAMCLAFVLIGAPLALRFPRGGVGLVIGASAGIFGLYYVGLIGGETLADKLIITPFWAMWAPNLLMTSAGAVLFLRLGREHATARGGSWTDALRARLERRRERRRARA